MLDRNSYIQSFKLFRNKGVIEKSATIPALVLEDNVKAPPMPAYVFYAKNGSKCGRNLAFTMLRKGLVRVITSYDDWSLEFNHHVIWCKDSKAEQS